MKRHLVVVSLLAAGFANAALANADLAEAKQCNVCHALAKETIGPSYRAIADRYAGKPDAYEMLVRKVKSGGWGHWGDIAMPPKTARAELSDQEAATLVKWVLQQK